MPDNTFILKKLPNVSELSLIFITQIIVMNMLATIAILESIFTISYNISDKKWLEPYVKMYASSHYFTC